MNTLTYSKKQILFSLALLWMAHFAVDFMIGIWSIYKTLAHLDLGKAGLIAGVCALIGEGSQIFTATLSDRGFRKHLLAIGIFATSASMLMSYTESYLLLFAFYLMTCLGSGAFHPTAIGALGSLKEHNKSIMIAGFSAFGALGMALSQIIFAELYFFLEGNTFWLVIPSFILFMFMIFHKFTLNPVRQNSDQAHTAHFKEYLQFFKNRHLSLLFVSQVCNQAVFWATVFLLPDVLVSRGYEAWLCYGGGHLIFILSAAIMMIPGGYLAARFSSRNVIFSATAISFIFYLIFYGLTLTPFQLIFCLAFLGAAMGMVNPISVALGVELSPKNPSMVSAFLMGFVWCISELLGQTGGGLLADIFSYDAPARALLTVNFLLLIGIACIYFLPIAAQEQKELEFKTI